MDRLSAFTQATYPASKRRAWGEAELEEEVLVLSLPVCIIPARGGSKRIPRKNIVDLAGRPMIGWAIAAARSSGLFKRIIVSTDDDEICTIAKEEGAETPFMRPAQLAEDFTPTIPVIAHAARWLIDRGESFSELCCLYATAALIRADDFAQARGRFLSEDWDYVFPAIRFDKSPFRGFVREQDGKVGLLFPEQEFARTQDLPAVFYDAGQFYWGKTEAWLAERPIFTSRSTIIEMPHDRVIDIDTPADLLRTQLVIADRETNERC